jgi:single-stranded DNA-binding protein
VTTNFQFLGGRSDNQGNDQSSGGYQKEPSRGGYPQQGGAAPNQQNFQGSTRPGGGQPPMQDEDIPF